MLAFAPDWALIAITGNVVKLCVLFVIGELACGNLKRRGEILTLLAALPGVTEADHEEVLTLVKARRVHGRGLGSIDMHLLASTILSGTTLWTVDRRLAAQARRLSVLFQD